MSRPSLLATDKYKPVMAIAGFPLRTETFVVMLRKGGPFLLPVDIPALVQELLPHPVEGDYRWLNSQGLHLDEGVRSALAGSVEVVSLPKGSWFGDREPVCTITGPSALVSWLEPLLLGALSFRIQVATLAKLHPESIPQRLGTVTCTRERELVLELLDTVGMHPKLNPTVDVDGYHAWVMGRARGLLEATGGDPNRVMEAGMRAASCLDQHRIAVAACKEAGFTATSNMLLARELGMKPAGTTGHEHTQRWGSDYAAFTAVRDNVPGRVTYLLDTDSTRHSGLPIAVQVMEESQRIAGVRYDSESTMEGDYLLGLHTLRERGLEHATMALGGGFDRARTERFEDLRRYFGWPAKQQLYLYGQYLVTPHVPLPTRGDVGAVYKLSRTGTRDTMKFSDNPAKSSIPGKPVVFRLRMADDAFAQHMPLSIIGQQGERPPERYVQLSGTEEAPYLSVEARARFVRNPVELSPATQALCDKLTRKREERIRKAISQ